MSATALNTRDRLVGLAETTQHLELALTIVTPILVERHHILLARQNKKLPLQVYHTIAGPSNRQAALVDQKESMSQELANRALLLVETTLRPTPRGDHRMETIRRPEGLC
jgi:hypothetical protein